MFSALNYSHGREKDKRRKGQKLVRASKGGQEVQNREKERNESSV
jgi:hypothetical protein